MSLGNTILGTASVLIRPSTDGFTSDLTSQVNKATASASGVSNSGSGLASFGKVATEAFVAVGAASVDMASKIDTAQAGLAQAIANGGQNFAQYKTQIDAAVASGEKLGNNEATTEQALTRLVSAVKSPTEAITALHAAQEIAAATGDNFSKVVVDLSHAADGNYTALERLGIITKEQVPTLGDFGDALQLISNRYGGVAQAQADTFGGQLKADRASIEDLAGAFGNDLIPVLEEAGKVTADVGDFFREHTTTAEAFAVVIGGVLTAAIGAYVVKIGQAVVGTIAETFTAGASAATTLATKLGIVTAAQQEETAAAKQAVAAQAATESSLAEVVSLLQSEVVYAQGAAEALGRLAAAQSQLALAAGTAGEEVASEDAYFADLQARLVATTESIDAQEEAFVDLMASEELSSAATAEFAAQISAMRAEVESLGPVLATAAAEGDAFAESTILIGSTLEILDAQLAESTGALAAFTAGEIATTTAADAAKTSEEGFALSASLAVPIIGGLALAAVGLTDKFFGVKDSAEAAGKAIANDLTQGLTGSTADKISEVKGQISQLQTTIDNLDKSTNFDLLKDLGLKSQDINELDQLKQSLQGLEEQQQAAAQAAAGSGSGVDTAAVANDQASLATAQTKLSDATEKVTDDYTKYQSATQTLATAQNTLATEQATVNEVMTRSGQYAITLGDDYLSMRSAALSLQDADQTLSDEQQSLSDIMHDTGQYARDLVDAESSLVSSQQAVTDDTVSLTTAQQNLSDAIHDTGQYALTLADDQNKLAASNTSLEDAQVKAAEAQQTWNQIQSDSGTYLESQTKDTIALQEAQLQAQDAATALATAQANLNNLTQDGKALTDALGEAHGNVALAQELSNIQQGDATQNSTAYQKAVEDVEKAQLDQKTATLSVKDAQQALLLLDQESILGTLAYKEQVVALQEAQQGVANATIEQRNAQQTLNDQLAQAIPGTQQYQTLVDDVAKAQNTLSEAVNTVANDQAKLTNLVDEAIPGTEQYADNQRTLSKDQVAVWQAQSQVNSTTSAYNNLLDESIPGTQQYRTLMNQLAIDQQAVANASQAQTTAQDNYNLALIGQANALRQVASAQAQLEEDKGGIGNFFKGLADNFLNFAKVAYGGPTGGQALPKRRAGGPVISGTAYEVGEAGPEVFVAPANGQIIPTSSFGGSSTGGIDINVANIAQLDAVVAQWAASNDTLAAAYNSTAKGPGGGQITLPAGLVQINLNGATSITSAQITDLSDTVTSAVHSVIIPVLQKIAGN